MEEYKKLWQLLERRRITKKELCARTGISSTTMRNITNEQDVTLEVLGKICAVLHANLGDIAQFVEL